MIFKAIVNEVDKKTNSVNVAIPIYGNEVYSVPCSAAPPGMGYQIIEKGSSVLICFLNNDLSKPVIIGVENSIITEANKSTILDKFNVTTLSNELVVKTKATLPADTKIGDSELLTRKEFEESIDKLLNYFKESLGVK